MYIPGMSKEGKVPENRKPSKCPMLREGERGDWRGHILSRKRPRTHLLGTYFYSQRKEKQFILRHPDSCFPWTLVFCVKTDRCPEFLGSMGKPPQESRLTGLKSSPGRGLHHHPFTDKAISGLSTPAPALWTTPSPIRHPAPLPHFHDPQQQY